MSEQKLKNAPLKEVIFELFWEGVTLPNEIPQDTGFENAVGKFQERVASIAPVQKRLYPASAPLKVFHMPLLQYWKGELKWPVIQHGPGILTVNETEHNYVWDDHFLPLVTVIIERLLESYGKTLPFNRVTLKYIDAADVADGNIHEFINENLRISLNLNFPLPGERTAFNLLQHFLLEDRSLMQLQVSSGANNANGSPAVVWITTVEKSGRIDKEQIIQWLNTAHDHCSKIFKTMLNPKYYASLDQ